MERAALVRCLPFLHSILHSHSHACRRFSIPSFPTFSRPSSFLRRRPSNRFSLFSPQAVLSHSPSPPPVMCRPTHQALKNVPSGGQSQMMRPKEKVVLVMGATGSGKTRLSVDLATCFPSEIINSDKMQVYEGLEIVTNKATKEEQRGVPHHLLGTQNPDTEFTASDFCDAASRAIESITRRDKVPIVVGGSNSYMEALVDRFGPRFEWCFLWVDVSVPVLYSYVGQRVDHMLRCGMVNELRPFFNVNGDYTRGIRKAIGVSEFHPYFRRETTASGETRMRLLQEAVRDVKGNTCDLARKQLGRIHMLRSEGWKIHRVCATPVFQKRGRDANEAWNNMVAKPCASIVSQFLYSSANSASGRVAPSMQPN